MRRLPFAALFFAVFACFFLSVRPASAVTFVGGAITTNTTWTAAASPYEVTSEVVVYNNARLTIEPGVTVQFNAGTGLVIGYYVYGLNQVNSQERGALTVNGTAASPVVFTSKSGATGGWKGLSFGDATDYGTLASSLNYLVVEKAGQPQTLNGSIAAVSANIMLFNTGTTFTLNNVEANGGSGIGIYVSGSSFNTSAAKAQNNASHGLYATGSTLGASGMLIANNNASGVFMSTTGGSLSGSTITGNNGYGIDSTSGSPSITNNTISLSAQYAIRYSIGNAPVITNNTLTNNTKQGIEVAGGALTSNHTWSYQNGEPFFTVTSTEIVVYNLATLTVGAGVTTKFSPNTGLVIGYYVYGLNQVNSAERGKLAVNGTAALPVLFTAANGAPGGWKGVSFGDATDYSTLGSSLAYLTVEKAGQAQTLGGSIAAVSANILLFNTGNNFTWNNVQANNGSGYGFYVSGSTLPLSGGGGSQNASWNLLMTAGSTGTSTGATFSGSSTGGVYIDGSSPTFSSCTVASNTGTGIHIRAGSTPTVSGSTIQNNRGYAVFTEDLASRSTIQTSSFSGNGKGSDQTAGTADDTYVMRVAVTSAVKQNTFAATSKAGIELVGGGVTSNFQWFLPGSGDYQHYVLLQETVVYNLAKLTVDAGVTTKFAAGTGLVIGYYVYGLNQVNSAERGSMAVNGTSALPVLFTSLSGASGGWKGVSFGDATDFGTLASSLSYLTIDRAGEAQTLGGSIAAVAAGLMMFNTGTTFTVDHVSVTASSGHGIHVSGSSFTSTFGGATGNAANGLFATGSTINVQGALFGQNNATGVYLQNTGGTLASSTITDNANYGIDTTGGSPTISANNISLNDNYAIRYIIGNAPAITGNTLTSNFNPGIEVVGGALTSNHAWSFQNGEPVFSVTGAEVVVYNLATLTVGAGVTTKFSSGTALVIGYYVYGLNQVNSAERGKLVVNGTAASRVLFTSKNGLTGGWKGLSFGDATDYSTLGSSLSYLTVERAGQAQTLNGSIAPVSANIMLFNTGTTFSFTGVEANYGSGVGIYVSGSTLPWSGGGAKSNASWGLHMVSGSNGTVASATFDASATGGGARVDDSSPTFSSCTFSNNLGTGLHIRAGATPTVNGGAFSSNRGYAVFTEDLASRATIQNANVSGNGKGADGAAGTGDDTYVMRVAATTAVKQNTFTGNGKAGIEMVGGGVTSNFQWFLPGTGDYQPYILLNETVVYNLAKLTVDAGVTTKFAAGVGLVIGYYVYGLNQVNSAERGSIAVNGTATAPVLFTSLSGASGGWRGLSFGDATDYSTLASTLTNLTVEKAGEPQTLNGSIGAVSANVMFFNTASTFSITNLWANSGSGYGIYLSGSSYNQTGGGAKSNGLNGIHATGSTVNLSGGAEVASNGSNGIFLSSTNGTIAGAKISGNTNYGIDTTGGSPTISGNTLSGNGKYAIRYPIGTAPSITNNTLTANTSPGIEVLGGALTTNHTWNRQTGEPVFTVHNAEIVVYNLANLTVAAGVSARFASGTGLVIGYYVYGLNQVNSAERGKLSVNGTGTQPVLFTAENNTSGGWRGVSFGDATDYSGLLSTLNHLIIEKAGQAQTLGGSIAAVSAGLMMFNTTVALNHLTVTGSSGTGIYSSGSAPAVKNSIVANNAGAGLVASGGTPSFTYGDVFGNGLSNSGWTAGTGSKTQNPLFMDYANGDYRLTSGSPCIDAGTIISGQTYFGPLPDMGAIEYGTGLDCAPGVPNGVPCEDGDLCTQADTCQQGECVGVPITCGGGNQCTAAGTCNPATGICSAATPLADGTSCNDNNACTQSDACAAGQCVGANPVACVGSDQCHVAGTCNPSTGLCSNPNAPAGTACNDDNLCTINDACFAGTCSGAPKSCTATGACFTGGTCEQSTGLCVSVSQPNGTACSDGNACTQGDVCLNGACNAGAPKTCADPDQCHAAGTCNPSNGVCGYAPLANGTGCSDGNACTQTDTCQSGVCQGQNPKACPGAGPCTTGVCSPADGSCSTVPVANGSACNDGNLCTTGDVCQSGACAGSPVACGETACAEAGSCNPSTGACVQAPKPDGTSCSDGNACTQTDVCVAGACSGSSPVTCAPPDQCHLAGTCNSSNGSCSYPVKPNGTACDDGDVCSTSSACQNGTCVATGGATDGDDDGVCDSSDNCPDTYNPTQADADNDGVGDACTAACVTIRRGGEGNVEDALLSGDYPTSASGTFFGSWTGLSSGGNQNRAVWQADLSPIPAGATVTSASFTFYVAWNAEYNLVSVFPVNQAWTEATATWNNLATAFEFDAIGAFQGGGVGERTVDITSLADAWVSGEIPNHGVLFDEPPIQHHYYYTSEAGNIAYRPRFDICYLVGAVPGTEDNPAVSCQAISDVIPGAPDGMYWIKPTPESAPSQVFCDMP